MWWLKNIFEKKTKKKKKKKDSEPKERDQFKID